MLEVFRYQRMDGTVPISEWLAGLKDVKAKAKLAIRFRRVSLGLFGDCKSVGAGVVELREAIGPGYRIYAGRHGEALVILLCAGTKHTQVADIELAKKYWQDWKWRNS